DIVELGIPFSDPLADGPQIQLSSQKALEGGISLSRILKIVEKVRVHSDIPIVLMGYINPIIAWRGADFYSTAAGAGVDGFIIPDLPIEEASTFRTACRSNGLSTIFLVAPTSSDKRISLTNRYSTDFVYAVTVTGVTGSGRKFGAETDAYLKRLKSQLSRPFVAGFGVSSAQIAKRLVRYADGVVIGSALVDLLRRSKTRTTRLQAVGRFLKSVRRAI
ncbi:MAG: tryptophan synthase subunit alpha, partial [candidate division Zixibacteria bacterium]|nr:tryptophan synthase subunit alpha [candidate division Zixibacteria bacterium]